MVKNLFVVAGLGREKKCKNKRFYLLNSRIENTLYAFEFLNKLQTLSWFKKRNDIHNGILK